jgi:clan AA aspartic protease (TIGR02281 family)
MKSKDVGTYYVDASVEDQQVSMLVDTGAAYTVLQKDIVDHLHLKPTRHITALFADGRHERVNLYVMPVLSVSSCEIKDVEFISMSSQINILGLSALKKMSPLTIELDESNMTFDCHKTR